MNYDITKPQAPKMPNLGNGTECTKIFLSQTSEDMHDFPFGRLSLQLGI